MMITMMMCGYMHGKVYTALLFVEDFTKRYGGSVEGWVSDDLGFLFFCCMRG
jgi:hypothetical protein